MVQIQEQCTAVHSKVHTCGLLAICWDVPAAANARANAMHTCVLWGHLERSASSVYYSGPPTTSILVDCISVLTQQFSQSWRHLRISCHLDGNLNHPVVLALAPLTLTSTKNTSGWRWWSLYAIPWANSGFVCSWVDSFWWYQDWATCWANWTMHVYPTRSFGARAHWQWSWHCYTSPILAVNTGLYWCAHNHSAWQIRYATGGYRESPGPWSSIQHKGPFSSTQISEAFH